MRMLMRLCLICGLVVVGITTSPLQAAGPSGAIFTTTANGSRVNANLYSSKCEVYLDGGPGPNAPAGAAGLPDGEYYFQVTDPSGKQLLSTDPVTNRSFLVSYGVIIAYTGFGGPAHPIGYDRDHADFGAITIRIGNQDCPVDYLDSPNGGGTYKVWVTPVNEFAGDPASVDNDCGNGCFHGFTPAKSKTDNFRAKVGADTFCLTVWKRLITGGQEGPGAQWPISVTDSVSVDNLYYTDQNGFTQTCGLSQGTYTVREDLQGSTILGLTVNGSILPAQPVYSFFWSPGNPEPVIVFTNGLGVPLPE